MAHVSGTADIEVGGEKEIQSGGGEEEAA